MVQDEELLGIHIDYCTGCGVCIAACPQAAITNQTRVEVRDAAANLICGKSASHGKDATVECIHSFGLEQLAKLNLRGVRKITVDTGDCSTCSSLPTETLQNYTSKFNRLMASHNLTELAVMVAHEKKDVQVRPTRREFDTVDPGKRRFLTALVSRPTKNDPDAHGMALSKLLSGNQGVAGDVLFPFVPVINEASCDGCGNCVEICQRGALTLVKDQDGEARYYVKSANCTDCGLCSDICPQDAITIYHMVPADCSTIRLVTFNCHSCGVSFHEPVAEREEAQRYCHVCRRVQHNSKLFQVLE